MTSIITSQDGKYLISGSGDTTVKVWNLEQKTEDFILECHTSYIFSVAKVKMESI